MPVVATAVTNLPSLAASRVRTAAQRASSTLWADAGRGLDGRSGVFEVFIMRRNIRPWRGSCTPILAFKLPAFVGVEPGLCLLFGHVFQLREALVKLIADHLLAVHDEANRLLEEVWCPLMLQVTAVPSPSALNVS